MANEISQGNDVLSSFAQRVSTAKDRLVEEENSLIKAGEKLREKTTRDTAEINDRSRRDVEFAHRKGNEQVATAQEFNLQNIKNYNKMSEDKLNELAAHTAEQIRQLDQRSAKEIHDFQASKMQKLLETSTRAEDAFYRPKHFDTNIDELEDHYDIKIKLPPYEARDVNVTGFSNQLKISFNRHYEAETPISKTQSNSTRSHESITETYYLPTNINFKKVSRSYAEGLLTIHIAKANPVLFDPNALENREKTAESEQISRDSVIAYNKAISKSSS